MPTIFLRLVILTYSALLSAGFTLVNIFLSRVAIAKKWNLAERSRGPLPKRQHTSGETVWVHAASIGEAKLLVRFLDILRKKHPGHSYVLTAVTKTGVDYLFAHDAPDIAAIGFLPIDTVGRHRKAIDAFGIKRVWIMETELWPSLLWTCMQRSIPIGLVNARMEQRSLASYRRYGWIIAGLLRYPDIVLAQNATYAERFERLGFARQRIHITGNLKSYVTVHPLPAAERAAMRSVMELDNNELCLTAGCLHADECDVLRDALNMVRDEGLALKCIVVPRHLRETPAIARTLGPNTVVLSEPRAPQVWNICIIDKMGILDAMYRIADAALVGGTFDPTGGHNMWDAAQFGIPVLFGPDVHTQQESCGALVKANVGFRVGDASELARTIIAVLRDKRDEFVRFRDQYILEINRRGNSIEDKVP